MKDALAILKSLADGNRLRVVAALLDNKELCVCYLTQMLGITTASVSRHMSILLAAGVVASRKDGRWVHYRLDTGLPPVLRKWLAANLADAPVMQRDRSRIVEIQERHSAEAACTQR